MNGAHIQQPRGRFALTGGRIILPDHIATDKTAIVEDGKIVAIADRDSVGSGVERIAVDGRYIAPGLIDIHIHGALGYTFNQPTPQAFAALAVLHVVALSVTEPEAKRLTPTRSLELRGCTLAALVVLHMVV